MTDTSLPALFHAYRIGTKFAHLLLPLVWQLRKSKGKETTSRKPERWGKYDIPRPIGTLIWLHAASVGETIAILSLIKSLKQNYPTANILLTTGTVTSAKLVEQRCADQVIHQFVPFDVPQLVKRFISHWQPDLAIFVEKELWPNLIQELQVKKIPHIIVNGRMSERSCKRWRKISSLVNFMLRGFSVCLVQTKEDQQRFKELGADEVIVTGSLKADSAAPPSDPKAIQDLKNAIADRPVVIAASTHNGEEKIVQAVDHEIRKAYPSLLTIIIPRHPARGEEIAKQLMGQANIVRRSTEKHLPNSSTEIYIADTLGEMGTFLQLSPLVFVGGSLIPHGGQNPLEALQLGALALHGPHVFNFTEIYKTIDDSGIGVPVQNELEMTEKLLEILENPELVHKAVKKSPEVLSKLTGGLEITVEVIMSHPKLNSFASKVGN